MRHATITLTMDTHGHLFPRAEADAIAKLGEIMNRHTKMSVDLSVPCVATVTFWRDWEYAARVAKECKKLRKYRCLCDKNKWPRRGSNPHRDFSPRDFKSLVSAIPPLGLDTSGSNNATYQKKRACE
jgi:hypothetical protein